MSDDVRAPFSFHPFEAAGPGGQNCRFTRAIGTVGARQHCPYAAHDLVHVGESPQVTAGINGRLLLVEVHEHGPLIAEALRVYAEHNEQQAALLLRLSALVDDYTASRALAAGGGDRVADAGRY